MLSSQLEIVEQAKSFLSSISQFDYTTVIKPHFAGSAGAHMRHVLDHYEALMNGIEEGFVDYNKRNRFADVERDPEAALDAWARIANWLQSICVDDMDKLLQVQSETSVEQTQYVTVNSTLARELVFVSSHAIHHFSLLAVISSLQGKDTPEYFGVAPATVTFMRQQA